VRPWVWLCFALVACRAPRPAVTSSRPAPEEPREYQDYEGEDPGWNQTVPTISSFPTSAGSEGSGEALVAEAVRELRAVQSTRYRHRTRVDEETGTFEFDCSGFVAYALTRVNPAALARVPVGPKGRARAEDFVAFFAGLGPDDPAWVPIRRGSDLGRGDLVAWLRPAEVTNTNTGHIAIVLERVGEAPTSSATTAIGGVRELLLRVADSTESAHTGDERGVETSTGLGAGIIGLVVDASDAPIGYRWRGNKSPKAFVTRIAIGRLR